MAKKTLTEERFQELMEEARMLAADLHAAAESWGYGLDRPFANLDQGAQALNMVAENALALQRRVLARMTMEADQRTLRATLEAQAKAQRD